MIRNYFKTAWRMMAKDRIYAAINISGLTIGLAACMLVFTVAIDEWSYDSSWARADDLYRMIMVDKRANAGEQRWPSSPLGLGYALRENFPEVEQVAMVNNVDSRLRISEEDPDGVALRLIYADTNALELLNFDVLSGHPSPFIAGQRNLLITESFSKKYFGEENPVGKIIEDIASSDGSPQAFLVTAVIRDIPSNTHLRAEAVALDKPDEGGDLTRAGIRGMRSVYYLLKPGTDARSFGEKVNAWFRDYVESPQRDNFSFELQPVRDIYLHSGFDSTLKIKGNIRTVYILSGIGALLLLIACINFINLSLARAAQRVKELGVRKVLGAGRRQVVIQYLSESLMFFAVSTCFALGLYLFAIPFTERFLGHDLAWTLLSESRLFVFSLLVMGVSVLTGTYPAWLFSGFNPSDTLKGRLSLHPVINTENIRKMLVVAQFTISVVVLVALLVVRQQLDYLSAKDIGYDKENLLHIGRSNWEGKGEAFKNELRKAPGIEYVSIAGWDPVSGQTTFFNNEVDHPLREGEKVRAYFIVADFDFAQTLGLRLREGRFLDKTYGNDAYSMEDAENINREEREKYMNSRSSLVTESTARLLGITETGIPIPRLGFPAAGILSDFHRESLHHALGPVFIVGQENPNFGQMFIRTVPGMERQARQSLAKAWKEFYPDRLLDVQWVADILDRQYEAEQKQRVLFSFFSVLMLLLSAMGVFGLILHAAHQRVKEIGIRKVLGASVLSITRLLSKDFLKLVLISCLIASPIAWWAMNRWLEGFAYRVDIEWWMFFAAGLAAVLIALATVSAQAIRAAVANPVKSLRNE